MQELLIAVARGLVEDKDAVRVTVDPAREDGTIVYHLSVAEGDMGRVIGKQGRIAKAIRVVMRAAAVRQGEKVVVEIDLSRPAQHFAAGKVLSFCLQSRIRRRTPCKPTCQPAKSSPPTVSAVR